MITKDQKVVKSWDEFEGAATYEYAQTEIITKNTTALETKK
jgi:hypothetical protein